MKADFSRWLFRQKQHYARVLQQQGRPQLDADWNEQVAILLHRLETLTGDLIGGTENRSGAPVDVAGFEIGPVSGEADNFTIGKGRLYVHGLCCECDRDTTYVDQPLPSEGKPDLDGISLVYLDAWEAVITPLDDPALEEPALSGMETTLRTRCVWQVRTHRLSHRHSHDMVALDFPAMRAESVEMVAGWRSRRRGQLRMRLSRPLPEAGRRPTGTIIGSGHFRGLENLLYRIEVHKGGLAGEATFKWSRENGTTLLALASLEGSVAHVVPAARQVASQLAPDTWLELSDSLDRALGRSCDMMKVVQADPSGRIEFSGPPSDGRSFKRGERSDVALRRWDQRATSGSHGGEPTSKGLTIIEGGHEANWLEIEDGIQIQFQVAGEHAHHYRTGDYWLLPARVANEGILLRSTAPQAPDGVEHYFAPLALFVPRTTRVIWDFRPTFLSLSSLQNQVNALSDAVENLRTQLAER
jgi:Family of unknown function (DUF6519)